MRRSISRLLASSLLSLMLLSTLIGGGCISCAQYFMWPGEKSCCEPDGSCKPKVPTQKSGGAECNKIAFDHQRSVDLNAALPAVTVTPFEAPAHQERAVASRAVPALAASPPDLLALHSSFRI